MDDKIISSLKRKYRKILRSVDEIPILISYKNHLWTGIGDIYKNIHVKRLTGVRHPELLIKALD